MINDIHWLVGATDKPPGHEYCADTQECLFRLREWRRELTDRQTDRERLALMLSGTVFASRDEGYWQTLQPNVHITRVQFIYKR